MARKKSAKKPARSAKKAARKGARKSGSRPAKGPVPVSSGRGASPAEIGAEVVQMIRASAGDPAIWARHWHNQCESVEGGKTAMAWRGMKQIKAKSDWWNQDHAIRGGSVEGPYIGATGFTIRFRAQVETLSTGAVESMEEVGVYTVKNGKVVREEFMGLTKGGDSDEA
jgi:hypothetical protein